MRRGVLIVMLALGVAAVLAAGADAGSLGIAVRPGRGGPATRFAVRFRAPDPAGRQGVVDRQYVVEASGRAGRRGCLSRISAPVRQAAAGERVRVMLDPGHGHAWCKGTFHGQIQETEAPVCGFREICPMFVVFVRRIGEFTFRVR
jgi:hypothetical protein